MRPLVPSLALKDDSGQGHKIRSRIPGPSAGHGGGDEKSLELRGFRVFIDDCGFNAGEAGALQHGFELGFAEAEPLVGVELAGLFEAMFGEVEDDDAAAGREDAGGFGQGALGMQGVVL